jgi:PRMT5 TIM barrel domain
MIFPTPPAEHLANFAQIVNAILQKSVSSQFWVRIPLCDSATQAEQENFTNDTWQRWNTLRVLCGHARSLSPAVVVTPDLPSKEALQVWTGEPIRCGIIPVETFTTDRKGRPALSEAHRNFVTYVRNSFLCARVCLRSCVAACGCVCSVFSISLLHPHHITSLHTSACTCTTAAPTSPLLLHNIPLIVNSSISGFLSSGRDHSELFRLRAQLIVSGDTSQVHGGAAAYSYYLRTLQVQSLRLTRKVCARSRCVLCLSAVLGTATPVALSCPPHHHHYHVT